LWRKLHSYFFIYFCCKTLRGSVVGWGSNIEVILIKVFLMLWSGFFRFRLGTSFQSGTNLFGFHKSQLISRLPQRRYHLQERFSLQIWMCGELVDCLVRIVQPFKEASVLHDLCPYLAYIYVIFPSSSCMWLYLVH